MTSTAALEQGMLDSINAVRTALNAAPLEQLPAGQPGEAEDCPGHRGLDGLGLGTFLVGTDAIDVNASFADIIKHAWGTELVPCDGHHEESAEACVYSHVVLPERAQDFIKVYDKEDIPHLIDRAAVAASVVARRVPELADA